MRSLIFSGYASAQAGGAWYEFVRSNEEFRVLLIYESELVGNPVFSPPREREWSGLSRAAELQV